MSIQVVVASEHVFVRDGLRCLLDTQPDISVVGDANDASTVMNLVMASRPDVAVIDLAIVLENEIKVTDGILRAWTNAKIIVFSLRRNSEYVEHSLDSGASGFVLAESLGQEIANAVREVYGGRQYLSPKLSFPATFAGRVMDKGHNLLG